MKKRKKRKKTQVVSKEKIKPKSISPAFWLKVAIIIQFTLLTQQFYPAPSTNGDNAKYFILGTAMSDFVFCFVIWAQVVFLMHGGYAYFSTPIKSAFEKVSVSEIFNRQNSLIKTLNSRLYILFDS